jgi:predicted NAD/FAD-binding protein
MLCSRHQVTVYEANDRIGGHANTVSVPSNGRTYPVDTGFVVFNEPAYPNFVKLLKRLGVASQPSDMSFSVQCERSGMEYASASLDALFAQRRNLLKPSFYKILFDIRRFYRNAHEVLNGSSEELTLGDYLRHRKFSREFINGHIIPMGSAIWSAAPNKLADFPARHFVQFFDNHGFLKLRDRSPWRTIRGGSREYVSAISAPFKDRIRLQAPVRSVRRHETHVDMQTDAFGTERFDQVVLATHSDQSLAMLADATPAEREVLGAIPYQRNETVLHRDARLLPSYRKAWSSWNYYKPADERDCVSITYYMNKLQSLAADDAFCVSLNRNSQIDEEQVIRRMTYHHPAYDSRSFDAQRRFQEINGVRRTHFCGAYWGYGFHEDGVRSALNVCKHFGVEL